MITEERGVLALRGKRITSFHTEETIEGMEQPYSKHCIYVGMDVIERLKMRQDLNCYYEDGDIKNMDFIMAQIDKTLIQASTNEHATYLLETDEETMITIVQATGNVTPATTIVRTPVNGKIELEIDSKVIGEVRIFAISDTKYANAVSITIV